MHISQAIIPGMASLYFLVSLFVNSPYESTILGLLAVASLVYILASNPPKRGKIIIYPTADGKKMFSLELRVPPEELEASDYVVFKVESQEEQTL